MTKTQLQPTTTHLLVLRTAKLNLLSQHFYNSCSFAFFSKLKETKRNSFASCQQYLRSTEKYIESERCCTSKLIKSLFHILSFSLLVKCGCFQLSIEVL